MALARSPLTVTLEEGVSIVAASPGQFDAVTSAAERQSVFKLGPRLVQVADCVGEKAQQPLEAHYALNRHPPMPGF